MNDRFKLLSEKDSLVIQPTDGKSTLGEARDIFSYIDSHFVRWNCQVPQPPTTHTTVQVYELTRDSTITEMFASLGVELDSLCLAQSQIIGFVKAFPEWLRRDGHGTFFLMRVADEFYVTPVFLFHDGRLGIHLRRYSLARPFRSHKRHRLVVPIIQKSA